ncbi:isopropylmalate isomerase [Rhodanobacter thiooxydans]|uniref:3-isopropylmalate dehydratase large subunit n=1 Tax=Rhodanobacter thiooxydans TaxID=416169 RepID=A0A154QEU5_9GAMM|nr:3-isopropylmalate dehydratase large subunit [Rhodanobacter thiooxydans]EIL99314.1 isopropylmalate isomerase large subunit [Rhodanobacter thiooxydans LCS2]KZC22754.1 isopropylmalate isomerase [Rhodanobacter thiooxydans]MCW0202135.1 3-isopropylmalate dehydratase large subunit [Rhodanobacter thiooxydans]
MTARTLYDKLWDSHCVAELPDGSSLLYIDLHLLHEVTSPQAFSNLRRAGRKPWRVDAALATPDHNVPTVLRELGLGGFDDPIARRQVDVLERNCHEFGVPLFPLGDVRQGIVHVVGPEQGLTLPGMTVVCGDSHTATHGALAALAYGIGSSEVEHVLATQTLRGRKSKNMAVVVDGVLGEGVVAKDLALHLIGRIGTAGASGHAIEFRGDGIGALSMEARMTLCNMSIEAGARVGLVAYDRVTQAYVKDRPFAPAGPQWAGAVRHWQDLHSDHDAHFDRIVGIRAEDVAPCVSWGTSPEMVVPISGAVPQLHEARDDVQRGDWSRAMAYMGLEAGRPIHGTPIDKVFVGSCTNARIEDLRAAARVLRGRRIDPRIKLALVVPGSGLVALQAEHEGLDEVFTAAGFEWRAPGCSMCLGMNADRLEPGERCASTSNRNFEGRQGRGGRTHLMSPAMAAAAAVAGAIVDVREL